MNARYARMYLAGFALLAFLPLFQQTMHPFKLAGLQGAFESGTAPSFTMRTWFRGAYQKSTDFFLKYNTAFNGELVRLRNQADYTLFGNINTNLTLGKGRYIYDPNYVRALEGADLISDSALTAKTKAIDQTIRVLESMHIPLLVFFAPNKAGYYPEFLPQTLHPATRTNRAVYDSLMQSRGIPVIGFDRWFGTMKRNAPYPLIPRYGAHWSVYGATLATDSLIRKIAAVTGLHPASIRVKGIRNSDHAEFTDDDYLPSLNMMEKWPSPNLAYPELEFIPGDRPDVLIISDSFVWNFYDLGIVQHCFASSSMTAYYFKTLYDAQKNKLGPLPSLSRSHLAHRNLVIILTSDPGLGNFGYGFFEAASKLSAHD